MWRHMSIAAATQQLVPAAAILLRLLRQPDLLIQHRHDTAPGHQCTALAAAATHIVWRRLQQRRSSLGTERVWLHVLAGLGIPDGIDRAPAAQVAAVYESYRAARMI